MIKIVKDSNDPELQYLNIDMFWRLYEEVNGKPATSCLVAVASTLDELVDAEDMLEDLTGKKYYAAMPRSQAN